MIFGFDVLSAWDAVLYAGLIRGFGRYCYARTDRVEL